MNNLLVSIVCICFNHESYLQDALDSFIIQQADFKFDIVISDDCSTDATRSVIRKYKTKYPELIKDVSPEEHLGLSPNFSHALFSATGKYIAICEGDDYWTDSSKLFRQVHFLENNLDYVAVAENGIVDDSTIGERYPFSSCRERDLSINDLMAGRQFPTASVVMRNDICKQLISITHNVYDTMLWSFACTRGKFRYFENVSSVYRRWGQGVVHNTEPMEWARTIEQWNLEIERIFCPKYLDSSIVKHNIFSTYRNTFDKVSDTNDKRRCLFCMIHYGGITSEIIRCCLLSSRTIGFMRRTIRRVKASFQCNWNKRPK